MPLTVFDADGTRRTIGTAVAPSIDGSGTITAANTPQVLFSGATPTGGWKVSFPVASGQQSTFIGYVSDTVTNPGAGVAGSYPVYAGGQYNTEPGEMPSGPVYLSCPTAGAAFSAKRW